MNDFYQSFADVFDRLAKLSPEKLQLLELLLKQGQTQAVNGKSVIDDYYSALANRSGWLDFADREVQYEETFLTFGPFPEVLPGFSWIMTGAYPETYQEFLPLVLHSQREMREVLFARVNFSNCQKILDFGCGYGSDLIALTRKYPHLQGCGYTIAREQAKIGNKKITAYQLQDRVTIFNRDSARDEFPDRYNLAFGFEVAHHIPDKSALFANLGNHLHQDGFLVLADFISNVDFTIEHAETSSFFITKEEWVELLSQNSLKVVDCIDVSQEIANFLYDPKFQENLDKIERINQDKNIAAAFKSYNGLGKLLRQRMASYVLMTAQKDNNLSLDELKDLNRQNLRELARYCQRVLEQGLYEVKWQPLDSLEVQPQRAKDWLILTDRGNVGKNLVSLLESQGDRCIIVARGTAYERLSDRHYTIDPAQPAHFQRLLSDNHAIGESTDWEIVHLWSLDETLTPESDASSLLKSQVASCGSVLHLVQAVLNRGYSKLPHLSLVTNQAVSVGDRPAAIQIKQSPLWGLGRVIALEHPELECQCIDLEEEANNSQISGLLLQLKAPDRENQVAWRQGVRYGARLVRRFFPTNESELVVKANSSYLITGGLGALGLQLAQWLAAQGARSLVLVGRSPASTSAQAAISRLEELGVRVLVAQADISQSVEMARVLEAIATSMPPLQGIIHAAGVLDDGLITQLDWQRFERVMAAKIAGAWNLHQLTENLPLDFFVCFSSITSVLGNAGQANYAAANAFLDALAYYRQGLGLPCLTVNWGPWAEVGMAARMGDRELNRLNVQGIGMISPNKGLSVLGELLKLGIPQVAAIPVNWEKFLQKFPSKTYPALLSEIAAQVDLYQKTENREAIAFPQTPEAIKQELPKASLEQRQQLLVGYLQNLIGQFLGYDSSNPPEPLLSFNELGLDSLTSIQLRNRVKTELEIDLPVAKFMGETNIDLLAKTMQEQYTLSHLLSSSASPHLSAQEEEEEMEEITI